MFEDTYVEDTYVCKKFVWVKLHLINKLSILQKIVVFFQ